MNVKLLTYPRYPIETLYLGWEASRHDSYLPTPEDLYSRCLIDPSLRRTVEETFLKVMEMRIPVGESLHFVFLIEDVPISLREQLVRHRIGTAVGDRIGMDFIPDLSQSSFWCQSMRMLDLGNFADEQRYFVPEGLVGKKVKGPDGEPMDADKLYRLTMRFIQQSYRSFTEAGVAFEDARNVIPLGASHRLTWSLNLSALQHIIGKRACWIAQLGIWEPIISGMVDELCKKVHPLFREVVAPPCMREGEFRGCTLDLINVERVNGRDPFPPCPLWLRRNEKVAVEESMTPVNIENLWVFEGIEGNLKWSCRNSTLQSQFGPMCERYEKLWGFDVWTGEEK